MSGASEIAYLADIVDAIELIRDEMAGVELGVFETDRRRRWLVERGIEIISEASRHLPAAMKAWHIQIPWPKVASIGNILRHEYQDIAPDVLWHVAHENLPPTEAACRAELARSLST